VDDPATPLVAFDPVAGIRCEITRGDRATCSFAL